MIRKVRYTDLPVLLNIVTNILEPLYGNQDKTIDGWIYGKHHKKAFVYLVDGEIAGLLSLKVIDNSDYLKISTLLVLEKYQNRGIGTEMLDFAESFARTNNFSLIKVTVSDEKPESLVFFQKHGFVIKEKILGKYKPNICENILFKGDFLNEK